MLNSRVILCDIGNTNFHFFYKGQMWHESYAKLTKKNESCMIYYISVNPLYEKKMLKYHKNCLDIASYIKLDTVYDGLGVDRKATCLPIENGVVVDAGSAITIDIMQGGIHLGGCIMPGICEYRKMFAKIDVLNVDLNLRVPLDVLPQNTADAVSYGCIKSIVSTIKNVIKDKFVYFTGGDGKFLSQFFPHSIYDDTLVFKGMLKAINDNVKGLK